MKSSMILYIIMFFVLVGAKSVSYAQSSPVLFFCERYDEYRGEIGVSDRFTKGYLTIMVKADKPLGLKDVHIQFDKYDCDAGKFNFYKKFDFTVDPGMKYIYFSKNESSDLRFDEVGFYRVFLLDNNNETVSSSLIEIIE